MSESGLRNYILIIYVLEHHGEFVRQWCHLISGNEENELERKEARCYILTFLEPAIHKGGKISHKKHIQWQNKIKKQELASWKRRKQIF